jgi:hypothetical protein
VRGNATPHTWLQAIVHLVRCRLVSAITHDGEFSLHHPCWAQSRVVRMTQTKNKGRGREPEYEPGWISVTRMGVSTTSRKREPVNARTAALLAQYTLPPAYDSLPAIEPRLMTWPVLRALKSVRNLLSAATVVRTGNCRRGTARRGSGLRSWGVKEMA